MKLNSDKNVIGFELVRHFYLVIFLFFFAAQQFSHQKFIECGHNCEKEIADAAGSGVKSPAGIEKKIKKRKKAIAIARAAAVALEAATMKAAAAEMAAGEVVETITTATAT